VNVHIDQPYRAFLLRLWQEQAATPDQPSIWRYSLDDPRTGERRGFGDIAALLHFLQACTGAGFEASSLGEVHTCETDS
jgi:hypothetical protein